MGPVFPPHTSGDLGAVTMLNLSVRSTTVETPPTVDSVS